LYLSEPLLDAFAQLAVGAVSHVVETDAGFHILLRRPKPEPGLLSGARVLINYSEARALPNTLLPSALLRTRAEALALATEVYRQAVARPETFQALVQQYSEHLDRSDGGYLGTWSRLEPTHLPREIDVLASLSVGEVAPPLDSAYGFELIQRTAAPADEQPIAVEVARLYFDASEGAEQAAEAQLVELLRASRTDPGQFDALRSSHCCIAPERWHRGREPGFTPSIQGLPIGAFTTEPLREHGSFAVARRIELARLPVQPPVKYELPAPSSPELDELDMFYPWTTVASQLAATSEWAQANVELMPAEAQQLRAYPFEPPNIRLALKDFLAQIETVLRPAVYARYRQQLDTRLENLLLQRGSSTILE
jgi:hypothetical protein